MNPYLGFPVIEYNGTNADDIVKALKLEEGDVVVCTPKPIICKAMAWQDVRFALDGTEHTHGVVQQWCDECGELEVDDPDVAALDGETT